MNKIYVVADLHLGHKKILEFEPLRSHFKSIEEHDETIIDNWNSLINKKDTVYVLGDVFFGREGIEKVKRLNGDKRLVMGNHDQYHVDIYREAFNKVFGSVVVKKCLLTHIPVHTSCVGRWLCNIHGHLHSNSVMINYGFGNVRFHKYYCVSLERTRFRPLLLDNILSGDADSI